MSLKRDIQNCKDYLNRVHEHLGQIQKIKLNHADTVTFGSDGMPRGTTISNKTMHAALDNVEIDNRIRNIQKKINKMQKNILKVLDKYDDDEKLMRDIIVGLYIQCKPKSLIQRELRLSNESFPSMLTQSYKTYTYYFYRAKKAKERE